MSARFNTAAHLRGRLAQLGRFMQENDVSGVLLAKRSGLSRRYIGDLRYARSSSTLDTMKCLAVAMGDILGSRVHLGELFDLDY